MIVLSIDPARSTGWALYQAGVTTIGTKLFRYNKGESPGMDFLRYGGWLEEMNKISMKPIDVIVYEDPHLRGKAATLLLVGFITKIKEFAAKYNIQVANLHTGTLKKYATGSGSASKEDMVAEAKRRGFGVQNDDEADAVLLLQYQLDELGVI